MKTPLMKLLVLLSCISFGGVASAKPTRLTVKKATPSPQRVKVVRPTPTLGAPHTVTRTAAPINFNGLIDQSGERKHRLAARLASKTKTSAHQRRAGNARVATIDFEEGGSRPSAPYALQPKREANSVMAPRHNPSFQGP